MLAANFIHLPLVCILIQNMVDKFLFIMLFMLLSCLDHVKKKMNPRNEWIKINVKLLILRCLIDPWSSWPHNQHQQKYWKRNLCLSGKWTGHPLKQPIRIASCVNQKMGKHSSCAQPIHDFLHTFPQFGDLLVGGPRHGFSSQPGKAIFFPTEDGGHYWCTGSALHCHT